VVRDGLVTKNAAAVVKRLGVARTEARHAATVDVTALLNAADRLRCRDMLVLIAATEMPRGEALGLRWTDIDLDAGLVDRARHPRAHRRQARGVRTQDRRSRRSALRWWRCCGRAASSKPPNGWTPGDQWTDCGRVFATEFGTPVEPRNLVRTIETAARKAGVKEVWVHIKAVADMLGHSSIAVTGDIYGHTSDDAARAAVDGMIGTLGLMQLVK
jgi:integrase